MPDYPDANLLSTTHHVQVNTVNTVNPDVDTAANNSRPIRYQMMEQTQVKDANLQKELLSEYKRNFKNESQEYAKFLVDKKYLIRILFGQCDKVTQGGPNGSGRGDCRNGQGNNSTTKYSFEGKWKTVRFPN